MQIIQKQEFVVQQISSIVEENINLNKGIEKDEKIKSSQTKILDNVNNKRQPGFIFDIKERCYDDSHIKLLKEYFFIMNIA